MKNAFIFAATLAALITQPLAAQQNNRQNQNDKKNQFPCGEPYQCEKPPSKKEKESNEFAWVIGLSALSVIGVVVGLTAGMASGSSN